MSVFQSRVCCCSGVRQTFYCSSAESSSLELSLIHDTKLVVLHYLSSDQTSSSPIDAALISGKNKNTRYFVDVI